MLSEHPTVDQEDFSLSTAEFSGKDAIDKLPNVTLRELQVTLGINSFLIKYPQKIQLFVALSSYSSCEGNAFSLLELLSHVLTKENAGSSFAAGNVMMEVLCNNVATDDHDVLVVIVIAVIFLGIKYIERYLKKQKHKNKNKKNCDTGRKIQHSLSLIETLN